MNRSTVAVLIAAGIGTMAAQTLTPRQLFYRQDAPAQPQPPAPSPAKPAPSQAPHKKTTAKKAKPPAKSASPDAPVQPAQTEAPVAPAEPIAVIPASYTGGMAAGPLGLRYALMQVANGVETEVTPNQVFHSGDMVRVRVEGNRDGYLYVIARGSSGNWTPLFPAPDIDGGNNRVQAHRSHELPSGTQAFTFDEQAGEEKLFIIYSTEPVRDIEQMIPSLSSPSKPAQAPDIVLASASMNDEFVSRLRNTYSRDLIVQTVTPQQPAESPQQKPESAVYVVNQFGGRVVADIRLEHK